VRQKPVAWNRARGLPAEVEGLDLFGLYETHFPRPFYERTKTAGCTLLTSTASRSRQVGGIPVFVTPIAVGLHLSFSSLKGKPVCFFSGCHGSLSRLYLLRSECLPFVYDVFYFPLLMQSSFRVSFFMLPCQGSIGTSFVRRNLLNLAVPLLACLSYDSYPVDSDLLVVSLALDNEQYHTGHVLKLDNT